VRLHLELIETATRIDPDDEDAVLAAAARIGNRDLLAPLHLLTAADAHATGPSTWSTWTATVVGTLVARLDAALSDEVDGAGIALRGERIRAAALEHMSAINTSDAERAFVAEAPLRYLASRQPDEVGRQAKLVAGLAQTSSAEDARVAVSMGPAPDTWAVTVAAVDRPELLARIAGAMALSGLDILALDAYGSAGHVALDTFVVCSATRRPVSTDTFASFERLLRAALKDRLELQTRLAERRMHYPARRQAPVTAEILSAGWDTAVRVSAPDRPGLLHDLARAVSSAGLDIRWAHVMTVDGIALDTFHVVGPDGGPVDDPGTLGHLAMRLREVR
jgi:[protein-PII] uridylyltransferase